MKIKSKLKNAQIIIKNKTKKLNKDLDFLNLKETKSQRLFTT